MKETELRIGNWVLEDDTQQVGQVDLVIIEIIERELNHTYKPIPLTEEWLERFGFEKIQMSIPTAYKTKDGFRIKKDQRGYWMQYKYGMTIIKHVHQLQNLYFALTGEELHTDKTNKTVNQ
jgi:hypothetical protein